MDDLDLQSVHMDAHDFLTEACVRNRGRVCPGLSAATTRLRGTLSLDSSLPDAEVRNKSWFSLHRGLRELIKNWTLEMISVQALVTEASLRVATVAFRDLPSYVTDALALP